MPNPDKIREMFRTLPTVPAFKEPTEDQTWVASEDGARFAVWKEQRMFQMPRTHSLISLIFCSFSVQGEEHAAARIVGDFKRVFGEPVARKVLEDPHMEFVIWDAAKMKPVGN